MTNLEQMRKFYRVYARDSIPQTLSEESQDLPVTTTGRRLFLSWSHYVFLVRVDDVDERHFYEIEAARNNWSLKELKRQFNTALYERFALSRDIPVNPRCARPSSRPVGLTRGPQLGVHFH